MILAADWVNPLIAGAAGVFGALVAVAGSIWVTLHRDTKAQERERREALNGFYSAANGLGHFYYVWTNMKTGAGGGTVGDVRLSIRVGGARNLLLTRMFGLTDAFWQASAHAMSILDEEAQKVVSSVEQAVGEWNLDEATDAAVPESWAPAIRNLRLLVERRGLETIPETETPPSGH